MNNTLPTINERCFTEPYKAHELFMNTHTVIVVTDTQAYYYIDMWERPPKKMYHAHME